MKVILESFRFLFISIVLLTFLGGIAYLTYSTTGVNLESYDWILVITAFILTLYIFKKKGWGKVYHKTFFLDFPNYGYFLLNTNSRSISVTFTRN